MFGCKVDVRSMEDRVKRLEAYPVEKGRILFYGHSLFTRCSVEPINHWGHPVLEDSVLAKDGSKACLNHGFGSSCAEHLLYYYNRLVTPYEPRALVLATGGNDFGRGYSPEEVMFLTARVIEYFQADFPGAPVYLFTYDPSVKGKGAKTSVRFLRRYFDEMVEEYCRTREGCTAVRLIDQPFYFDDPADIGDYDKIREDIFDTDQNHLNTKGYEMFMDFLRNLLEDIL